jgi:hypothetical protein
MPKLSAAAIHGHQAAKLTQSGGGVPQPVLGPKCKGGPPGPNGQCGGGLLPNYGPEIKNKSTPPGPTAS